MCSETISGYVRLCTLLKTRIANNAKFRRLHEWHQVWKSLVDEVNAKRKAGYQQIAAKQGISLTEVEKVGGNTAIEKTLRGNYIRDASGTWIKK